MAAASEGEDSDFPGVFFDTEAVVRAPAATGRNERGRAAAPGKPPGRGVLRLGRVLAALGLLGAGFYAVLDDHLSLSTDHAVVSAYTVKLRSAIAGTVSGLHARPGTVVAAGARLAAVEDDRADRQRLDDLRGGRDRVRAELDAGLAAGAELRRLRAELEARDARHLQAAAAWLSAQTEEAERLLAAARAREGQARREAERKARLAASGYAAAADLDRTRAEQQVAAREAERKARLAASGYVAAADLDRTRAEQQVAAREAEAQERRMAALRAQEAGLRQGIFLDTGGSGTAYAAQRRDEVALRLVEIGRSTAALEAEAGALAVQLREEERRSDRLRRAELPAPASGTLWRVLALYTGALANEVAEIAPVRTLGRAMRRVLG